MEARERFNGQWAGLHAGAVDLRRLMIVATGELAALARAAPASGGVAISRGRVGPGAIAITEAGAPVFRLPDQVVMLGRALMIEVFLAFEIIC
jgi:hypothetical protein